jgi:hypothetical protein
MGQAACLAGNALFRWQTNGEAATFPGTPLAAPELARSSRPIHLRDAIATVDPISHPSPGRKKRQILGNPNVAARRKAQTSHYPGVPGAGRCDRPSGPRVAAIPEKMRGNREVKPHEGRRVARPHPAGMFGAISPSPPDFPVEPPAYRQPRKWVAWAKNEAFAGSSGFSAGSGPIVFSERDRMHIGGNATSKEEGGVRTFAHRCVEPFHTEFRVLNAFSGDALPRRNCRIGDSQGGNRWVLDRLHDRWRG